MGFGLPVPAKAEMAALSAGPKAVQQHFDFRRRRKDKGTDA
jgi:hypothetical protein